MPVHGKHIFAHRRCPIVGNHVASHRDKERGLVQRRSLREQPPWHSGIQGYFHYPPLHI